MCAKALLTRTSLMSKGDMINAIHYRQQSTYVVQIIDLDS